jgi:hypothetical protein
MIGYDDYLDTQWYENDRSFKTLFDAEIMRMASKFDFNEPSDVLEFVREIEAKLLDMNG